MSAPYNLAYERHEKIAITRGDSKSKLLSQLRFESFKPSSNLEKTKYGLTDESLTLLHDTFGFKLSPETPIQLIPFLIDHVNDIEAGIHLVGRTGAITDTTGTIGSSRISGLGAMAHLDTLAYENLTDKPTLTTGATGPAGDTGAAGPRGPAGADGSDGARGPEGAVGDTGPAGAVGDTGAAGAAGTNGSDGARGPAGAVGDTGAAGANGTQGIQGLKGDTGAAGTNGSDGARGPAGAVGARGPAGADGSDGARGPAGAAGADGAVIPGTFGRDGLGNLVNIQFDGRNVVFNFSERSVSCEFPHNLLK